MSGPVRELLRSFVDYTRSVLILALALACGGITVATVWWLVQDVLGGPAALGVALGLLPAAAVCVLVVQRIGGGFVRLWRGLS